VLAGLDGLAENLLDSVLVHVQINVSRSTMTLQHTARRLVLLVCETMPDICSGMDFVAREENGSENMKHHNEDG
jgi:hypothetical protein